MKQAQELLPWKVTDISVYPYGPDYWSMNPSIHLDNDGTWRCVARIVDYSMPDGHTIRSKNARPTGQQTKNAMVIFDPQTWRAVKIFKMHERDGLPRASTPHVGYEDMRIFRTDKGGLQGIAASLHLSRRDEDDRTFDQRASEATPQHQPPEQVLLSFDESYDIIAAQPIRGDGFSGIPQKNWVPFDHAAEPRFLYSIDRGTMFDERGKLHGDAAQVKPSIHAPTVAASTALAPRAVPLPPRPEAPVEEVLAEPSRHSSGVDPKDSVDADDKREGKKKSKRPSTVRGGRIKLDTISSRPTARPAKSTRRPVATRNADDSMRMMGSGRVLLPTYEGLRGGSQLVQVADDAWLGVGHEMKFVNGKKYYYHTWYLVNSRGKMTAASDPMKLASAGIEFAAGMAIDGDRVVVSFGVDDMNSMLGETRLSAVMERLQPIKR